MPTIEIEVSDRIARHVATVRLMSYMVFPDNPDLRTASEVTFRTKLADWYSGVFAEEKKEAQRRVLRGVKPGGTGRNRCLSGSRARPSSR
jgi:hypothetical protein